MNEDMAVPAPKPSLIRATWKGDRLFDTGKPSGPQALIDGDGKQGQSPPEALLSALITCAGVDLVDYLAKRRTPVATLTMDVTGHRRHDPPRRYEHIIITFSVTGEGIERVHAERAVQLAYERYCSVAATLAPDVVMETIVALNGEAGEKVRQPNFVKT
jgi:putative redox protein